MSQVPSKRFFSLLSAFLACLFLTSFLASCSIIAIGPADTTAAESGSDPAETGTQTLPPTSVTEENPALVVTELMSINTVGIKDSTGACSPWIEFQNISDAEVNLSDYTLSLDDYDNLQLPAMKIPAGEFAILFVNGINSENSVNARMESKGRLTLMHGDAITALFIYRNKTENHSYLPATGGETAHPTPGYSAVREKDNLIISELIASNSLFPISGMDCDWIELYNDSDSPIDLSTYYLSTNESNPFRCQLPAITLASGDYTVLRCGAELDFNLSKSGEAVFLTRNDGVLASSVTFGALEQDTVWTYDHGVVTYPTPGYANRAENTMKVITDRRGIVISEVVSSNSKYAPLNREYYDLVELWNNTDAAINLSDYYLSDKGSQLQRYHLPDVTLDPGAYYVVHCASDGTDTAPFSISSKGEKLFVSRSDGTIVDALAVPALQTDRSWGRYESTLVYFTTPTPGKANPEGQSSVTAAPVASVASGIYTEAQQVTLSGSGTIYYTTDGKKPTKSSKKYNGETITISETTAIRAIAYDGDKIPSEGVTFNYLISIPDYTLPIMKITMPDADLFGANGVYSNPLRRIEKEANLTFFVDGKEEFSIDCGLKVFGAGSRYYTKLSLQVEFRKTYGTSRLEYPLFENNLIDSFSNIVLRSGSQGMFWTDAMFTDEFITSLASTGGQMPLLLSQSYRPCNLYLNGEYYGVYFIREKIDEAFIADHCNINENTVTLVTLASSYGTYNSEWKAVWNKIYTNKLDFSKEENYRWLTEQINIESFTDLVIMRMYAGDTDHLNVRLFKSPDYDGGRWNFILYDLDLSYRSTSQLQNRVQLFLNASSLEQKQAIFRALMENEEYRQYFLARLAHHLNTTLSGETAQARAAAMIAELENDMPYQIDRWKDIPMDGEGGTLKYLQSMSQWRNNAQTLYDRSGQDHVKWYVQDVAKAMNLTAEDIATYMGEEFVQYLET